MNEALFQVEQAVKAHDLSLAKAWVRIEELDSLRDKLDDAWGAVDELWERLSFLEAWAEGRDADPYRSTVRPE